jgi:hypothetical protein
MAMFDTPLNSMWTGFMAGLASNGQPAQKTGVGVDVGELLSWSKDMRTQIDNMAGHGDAAEVHQMLQHGAALFGAENISQDLNPDSFAYRYGLKSPMQGPQSAVMESEAATMPAEFEGIASLPEDEPNDILGPATDPGARIAASASEYQRQGYGKEGTYHDLIAKRNATNETIAEATIGFEGGPMTPNQFLQRVTGKRNNETRELEKLGTDKDVLELIADPVMRVAAVNHYRDHLARENLSGKLVEDYVAAMIKTFELMDEGVDAAEADAEAWREYSNKLVKDIQSWAVRAVGYQGSLEQDDIANIELILSPTQRADWNKLVREGIDLIDDNGMNATLAGVQRELYDRYAGKLESFLYTKPTNYQATPPETWTQENQAVWYGLEPGTHTEQGPDGNLYYSSLNPDGTSAKDWKPVDMAAALERAKEVGHMQGPPPEEDPPELTETEEELQARLIDTGLGYRALRTDTEEGWAKRDTEQQQKDARLLDQQASRVDPELGAEAVGVNAFAEEPLPEGYGSNINVGIWAQQKSMLPPGYAESLLRTVGDEQPTEPDTGEPGRRDGFRLFDPSSLAAGQPHWGSDMTRPVTDPKLLAELNALADGKPMPTKSLLGHGGADPSIDPNVLRALNSVTAGRLDAGYRTQWEVAVDQIMPALVEQGVDKNIALDLFKSFGGGFTTGWTNLLTAAGALLQNEDMARMGMAGTEKLDQVFGVDDPSWFDKLANGLGFMATLLIPGMGVGKIGKVAGAIQKTGANAKALHMLVGASTMSGFEAAMEAGSQIDQKMRYEGLSLEQAAEEAAPAVLPNIIASTAMNLPLFSSLKLFPKAVIEAATEGGQEIYQGYLNDWVMQERGQGGIPQLARTARQNWDSHWEEGGIGAVIGFAAGMVFGRHAGIKFTDHRDQVDKVTPEEKKEREEKAKKGTSLVQAIKNTTEIPEGKMAEYRDEVAAMGDKDLARRLEWLRNEAQGGSTDINTVARYAAAYNETEFRINSNEFAKLESSKIKQYISNVLELSPEDRTMEEDLWAAHGVTELVMRQEIGLEEGQKLATELGVPAWVVEKLPISEEPGVSPAPEVDPELYLAYEVAALSRIGERGRAAVAERKAAKAGKRVLKAGEKVGPQPGDPRDDRGSERTPADRPGSAPQQGEREAVRRRP